MIVFYYIKGGGIILYRGEYILSKTLRSKIKNNNHKKLTINFNRTILLKNKNKMVKKKKLKNYNINSYKYIKLLLHII